MVRRSERKGFILSKYQDVHFVRRSHSSPAALRIGLQEATKSCDIYSLIQLYAQRTDLSQALHTHIQVCSQQIRSLHTGHLLLHAHWPLWPVPASKRLNISFDTYAMLQLKLECKYSYERTTLLFPCRQEKGETALHLAVLLGDRTSLHILDFLAQNWSVRRSTGLLREFVFMSLLLLIQQFCVFVCFFSTAALMLMHRRHQETQPCTTVVSTTRRTVWNCCWGPEPTYTSVRHSHKHTRYSKREVTLNLKNRCTCVCFCVCVKRTR